MPLLASQPNWRLGSGTEVKTKGRKEMPEQQHRVLFSSRLQKQQSGLPANEDPNLNSGSDCLQREVHVVELHEPQVQCP